METVRRTLIPYLYRDADNYKVPGLLVADGVLSPSELATLRECLWDEEKFVPTQVGLRHLGYTDDRMVGFPGEADHPLHEIWLDQIEVISGPAPEHAVAVGDATAFVQRMLAASEQGWDLSPLDPPD